VALEVAANGFFISIQTELEVEDPPPSSAGPPIGVDLGIERFAALSNGEFIDFPDLSKLEKKALRAQKALSKKMKGSKNRAKARRKLAKIHAKIARVRKDFLHKASARLCGAHSTIAVEDLQIKNMSASASGTVEEPGKNVAAKAGLNRSILRQGWGFSGIFWRIKAWLAEWFF
jgi:putative transposase